MRCHYENTLDAKSIFDQFQTRRDVLRRTGQFGMLAGLPMTLAACLEVPDNASSLQNGVTRIQLMEGRNAWGNQVFYYNKKRQEVSVTGREAVAMPATLQEATTVSESEFKSLLTLTRQAPLIWTPSDGNGSAGTGGGGNGGGSDSI